jgi:hypothetical protein
LREPLKRIHDKSGSRDQVQLDSFTALFEENQEHRRGIAPVSTLKVFFRFGLVVQGFYEKTLFG